MSGGRKHRPRPHLGRSCVEIWYYWRQCNRCNRDHAHVFADQWSVACGAFLNGSKRVATGCQTSAVHYHPPTLESPVQLGRVMVLSRPNSTPWTRHTAQMVLFPFIFASGWNSHTLLSGRCETERVFAGTSRGGELGERPSRRLQQDCTRASSHFNSLPGLALPETKEKKSGGSNQQCARSNNGRTAANCIRDGHQPQPEPQPEPEPQPQPQPEPQPELRTSTRTQTAILNISLVCGLAG